MKRKRYFIVIILIVFIAGCASLVHNEINQTLVRIGHSWLSPSEVIIPQGMTVTWVNTVSVSKGYTVLSNYEIFRSRALYEGKSFKFRFTQPGIYEYHIKGHPQTRGKIIVEKSYSYVSY